jgi:hypothetical protein
MALYIPHSIFHLARFLYVRPETFGPYYVRWKGELHTGVWWVDLREIAYLEDLGLARMIT